MKLRNTFAMALGAGVVAIGMASTASAQVYSEDFQSGDTLATLGFTIEDLSGDGSGSGEPTWFNEVEYAVCYWDDNEASNDWMITPAIAMNNGEMYQIEYLRDVPDAFGVDELAVYISTTPTSAGMLGGTLLEDLDGPVSGTYSMPFTATSTGNYYLGFHAKSPANFWYVVVDDIVVTSLAVPPGPTSITLPADASTDHNTGVQVFWSAASGATDYDLWLTTNAGDLATTPPGIAADQTGLTINATNVEGLAAATTYYMMVGANNGAGTTYSPVSSFTTRAAAMNAGDILWRENFDTSVTMPIPGFEAYEFDGGTAANPAYDNWNLIDRAQATTAPRIIASIYNNGGAGAPQNDDWLLLPEFTTDAVLFTVVEFDAWSQDTSGSFDERMEVYKGTGSSPPAGYTLIDTVDPLPNWSVAITNFQYDLDQGVTQRLAIRNASQDDFYLNVDSIEIRLQAFSANVTDWTVLD